jgi:16S rRNA (uracil1498-N3)-methyltransferase
MHRFYLRPENWESATLDAEESHHCLNVLRLSEGDRVTVFDGAGREGQAVIAATAGSKAKLKISSTATTPPPPCAITLAQAVPKGKNMDLIVQKAVELGAARIVPLLSDRTIVQVDAGEAAKKREKWNAIALRFTLFNADSEAGGAMKFNRICCSCPTLNRDVFKLSFSNLRCVFIGTRRWNNNSNR